MSSHSIRSWGNVLRYEHETLSLRSRFDSFPRIKAGCSVLPFGNGRSYGDTCLNDGGALLKMRSLDRFIAFDRNTGVLVCESGVLLEEILRLVVPTGWFPQVVPGTQYVTVGGMIANDVHGKNHHRVGTFGRHVRRIELLRSTGERLICSPTENAEWFRATIGGLGLTGVITWAELQLRPIAGPWMDVESARFVNLNEFFELSAQSDGTFEYVVSWIDCLARSKNLGRGLLQRANHSVENPTRPRRRGVRLVFPFTPPISLVNSVSVRVLNNILYYRNHSKRRHARDHFQKFFFPLDRIQSWNRMYGPRGFYQYQCVVPEAAARESMVELLSAIARSGSGSFLTVLKRCGDAEQPGLLSFPMPGITLALDFPNHPARIQRLFPELDAIVSAAGGRLYPAKDGRMSRRLFRVGYPQWSELSRFVDPCCSSSFWRRVGDEQIPCEGAAETGAGTQKRETGGVLART